MQAKPVLIAGAAATRVGAVGTERWILWAARGTPTSWLSSALRLDGDRWPRAFRSCRALRLAIDRPIPGRLGIPTTSSAGPLVRVRPKRPLRPWGRKKPG